MATSLASKPRNYFATTQWTVALSAGHSETTRGRDALAALCKTYWYPLYAFVRRQGHSPYVSCNFQNRNFVCEQNRKVCEQKRNKVLLTDFFVAQFEYWL